jgi:hypothetical protein
VLLNANVAFLALPSVDSGTHNRTPVQLANYLSIVASLGTIVIGLLLLHRHRSKAEKFESSEEIVSYFTRSTVFDND